MSDRRSRQHRSQHRQNQWRALLSWQFGLAMLVLGGVMITFPDYEFSPVAGDLKRFENRAWSAPTGWGLIAYGTGVLVFAGIRKHSK